MKGLSEKKAIYGIPGILARLLEIPEEDVTFEKARVNTADGNPVNVQSM
jgi:hypothetical protein